MNSVLLELNKIDTVMGSFIFSNQAEVIASEVPDFFIHQLPQAVELILRSFAPQQAEQDDWDLKFLYVKFEEGLLFCRKINDLYLSVVASPETKIPFLNVALNVATQRLKTIPQQSGSGSQFAPPPSSSGYFHYSGSGTGNHPVMNASGAHPPVQHHSQNAMAYSQGAPPSHPGTPSAGHGSFTSGSGQFAHQSSSWTPAPMTNFQPPENCVSVETIKIIAKILAQFVGPAAKVVVKKHIRMLGATVHTLPVSQLPELLSFIENELDDPEARMTFREETSHLL